MNFKAIKTKDRLPDLNKRVFFFNSTYGLGFNIETGFIKEYNPHEKIEVKKGVFVEFKDCKVATDYLVSNFDYWLDKDE